MSIGNLTPAHVHYSKTTIKTERLWKPVVHLNKKEKVAH
jgi:hypothetical protein